MKQCLPQVKRRSQGSGHSRRFGSLRIHSQVDFLADAQRLLEMRLWDLKALKGEASPLPLQVLPFGAQHKQGLDAYALEVFDQQGYCLDIQEEKVTIYCGGRSGFHHAVSTLKQLLQTEENGFFLACQHITDWPDVAWRSLSTTFSWYAGYGRFGFDSQLWGFAQWKQFLNICADYKINQLNMCMYGYWPFAMPEYPGTALQGLRMRLWNAESENWVETCYMHPNIAREFLPQLIDYGHQLGIQFFAYIGLNSYSGGYANLYPQSRMQRPRDCPYINDFDSLCLNSDGTMDYLRYCLRRVIEQGFDGVDFEESEEAFWYCDCPRCKQTFWQDAATPEEALHHANTYLLGVLYEELKRLKPDVVVGLRAWRQPPLVRDEALLASMVASIPQDVVLFWAPGQYVADSEFDKWIAAFGRQRIRARDTEAMGFAAGLGRLVRPFRCNGLRTQEESITQFIEEDIRQHRGSAQRHVAGINGYQFEWYGFFMAFFAHAYYGWGGDLEPEAFYRYALETVFGPLAGDIYDVMMGMLTIHESQLNLFELEFPFARNKVEQRDIPLLEEAIRRYPQLMEKLRRILAAAAADERLRPFRLHFKKWQVSLQRSRIIYDMALASLRYGEAKTQEEKRRWLMAMDRANEAEFDIIRQNYFDVNPVAETGIKSCMIPYHELKRVIHNQLDPAHADPEHIYLGVESLGWLWA